MLRHYAPLLPYGQTRFLRVIAKVWGEISEVALGQFVATAESWGLREVLLLLEEVEAWPQLAQRLDQCTDADLQE